MAKKVIMAWSKCKLQIGKMGSDESMSTSLTEIGPLKYQSTELTADDGDTLQMQEEGAGQVGYEQLPGAYSLTTRVIEPDDSLYTLLGLGSVGTETGSFKVSTHVVEYYFSLQVDPLHTGARGIKAPKCSVSVKPGYSTQDGNYMDLTFGILNGSAGYWYERTTKTAESA